MTTTIDYSPIRKIVAAAVAAGIFYIARQVGLDLGSDDVNEAALGIVAIAAGYLTPDPRVR